MILLRAETLYLRSELTDAEIRARRAALAEAEVQADVTRWRIKVSKNLAKPLLESIAASKPSAIRDEKEARYATERLKQRELGALLKTATEAAADLVETLARGWEMRDVRIEVRRDGSDVVTIRTDTGEILDRRAATDDEIRQPGEDD